MQERGGYVGFTVEKYAQKKANEEYVFKILYKNKDFKELYYTREEFNLLDDKKVSEIITIYNEVGGLISDL